MIKHILPDGYICLPVSNDCAYLQIQYSNVSNTTRLLYANTRDFITNRKIIRMNNELEIEGECQNLIYQMTQNT